MRFRIPGTQLKARLAEPVVADNDQYMIVDFGIEHADGGIDSIVVGAAAYSLKRAIDNANARVDADAVA